MTKEEVITAIFKLQEEIGRAGYKHTACLLLAVCYAAFDSKASCDLYEHVDEWMMKNAPQETKETP